MRYAFVCGCPRSGTTALAMLMNWHPAILMGQERYANLLHHAPERLQPGLFEAERFLQHLPQDCPPANFQQSVAADQWHDRPGKGADIARATVRGDKATHLFNHFDVFESEAWRERDVTIYAMLRDVTEVAASYEARLRDANDQWSDDRFAALQDWTQAVTELSRQFSYRRTKFRIRLVCYEAILDRGLPGMLDATGRILADLGLEMDDETRQGVELVHRYGEARREIRLRDPELRSEVARLVPAEALKQYERLKDLAFIL